MILTVVDDLSEGYAITSLVIFILTLIIFLLIIWRQPQNTNISTFKIPLVPFFPMISIFINIYLMMSLDVQTWIRFAIWFAFGFIIYFSYGIRNSTENKKKLSWIPCLELEIPNQSIEISKL